MPVVVLRPSEGLKYLGLDNRLRRKRGCCVRALGSTMMRRMSPWRGRSSAFVSDVATVVEPSARRDIRVDVVVTEAPREGHCGETQRRMSSHHSRGLLVVEYVTHRVSSLVTDDEKSPNVENTFSAYTNRLHKVGQPQHRPV